MTKQGNKQKGKKAWGWKRGKSKKGNKRARHAKRKQKRMPETGKKASSNNKLTRKALGLLSGSKQKPKMHEQKKSQKMS